MEEYLMRYVFLRVLAVTFFSLGLYCRTTYAVPLDVTGDRQICSAPVIYC